MEQKSRCSAAIYMRPVGVMTRRVIEERNGSGQVLKLYTWGQQYIDELVRIRTRHGGARSFYVMQDANYNVLGLVNEFGRQVERYEYTPYGERTVYSYGVLLADTNGDGVVDTLGENFAKNPVAPGDAIYRALTTDPSGNRGGTWLNAIRAAELNVPGVP